MSEENLPLAGGQKATFVAPSGYIYTIREQNGADDDILSNPEEAKTLTNLARFIAGIVTETDADPSGKLTLQKAYNLPLLDAYYILIKSRIHSMGPELEFSYKWSNKNEVPYSQDLNDFIFKDYSQVPTDEEFESKPDAIPYYPYGAAIGKEVEFTTTSGHKLKFGLNTLKSESYKINLPKNKQTKNQDLIARGLAMEISGEYHKVLDFSFLTRKDLKEIRTEIAKHDPEFNGTTTIINPATDEEALISIFGINDFFYPGEN